MEQEQLVIGSPITHVERNRLAAIGAGSLDVAIGVQRRTDPERVPGAVAVPPPSGSLNAVRGRHRREWVGHSNLDGARAEHERMLAMKRTPGSLDLYAREVRGARHFLNRRSPTQLDKHPVGQVANFKQPRIHWPILPLELGLALAVVENWVTSADSTPAYVVNPDSGPYMGDRRGLGERGVLEFAVVTHHLRRRFREW